MVEGLPWWSCVKNSSCSAGNVGLTQGSKISYATKSTCHNKTRCSYIDRYFLKNRMDDSDSAFCK